MWTFIVSDRRFGQKTYISQNCDEVYTIGPTGTWVPDIDVKWLESIRWPCPKTGERIQVFSKGNPTQKQMAQKPSRAPKVKTSHKPSSKKRRRNKEV